LSHKLSDFILYSIVLAGSEEQANTMSTEEALKRMRTYFSSLSHYGETPFIYPLYGTSELAQGFCRHSAVNNGIFILRRGVEKITVDKETKLCKSIVSQGQQIKCDWFVTSSHYLSAIQRTATRLSSRCICITDRSLVEGDNLIFLVIPPTKTNSGKSVFVQQLESSLNVCPDGKFVVHFTVQSLRETAQQDLEEVVKLILCTDPNDTTTNKPMVLWSVYFNQCAHQIDENLIPSNVLICEDPNYNEFGYEAAIQAAMELFQKICPNQDFLPVQPSND